MASTPTLAVPLKPPVDPEHLHPTDNPDTVVGMPLWFQSDSAPTLPDALTSEGYGTPVGGGGPLDHTPRDPEFGVGGGHGQTTLEAQAIRGELHGADYGAVAVHAYEPMTDRDGQPHVAILYDTPGDGDSPATLQLKRTGVGQPNDPYARTGKRQKRWWDRIIDMHRYTPEYRPMYLRNAHGSVEMPATPHGMQLDSPYIANGPFLATPDNFVSPQERRTPVPWDQPLMGDGSAQQLTGVVNSYGLPSWGL